VADEDSVYLRGVSWYADNDVDLRLGARVERLDPSGSVTLGDGSHVAFERCLIATGGRVRKLHAPGDDLDGIHYLRTVRDAVALRGELARKPRVVVVGAGFIGAEVAASARALGCDVVMIEMLDVPLQRVLGDELAKTYAGIHTDNGVDLRTSEGVEGYTGEGRVEAVVGSSGTRYPADLVVVGVGIEPNIELAQAAGLACDNGIVTDEFCRTSAPNVYAAGDVASRPDVFTGKRIRVEHFQNAQNAGPAAARNMLGNDVPFQEVPWFWSDQYDVNLQMLGHSPPTPDRVVRGSLPARDFIAFDLDGDRIVAAVALNRGKDISAARRLIERRVSVDRTRLADEDVALRDLLRS
jgi:3-phenylpropionate/trans-cinnamate dioxygenase ferredoxin reductase subunit